MQVVEVEGLQQPQHLHVLAAARLDHPRLHQPAQGLELGRQVPLGQRRRLIQSARAKARALSRHRLSISEVVDYCAARWLVFPPPLTPSARPAPPTS
jgi:hypothetical protein